MHENESKEKELYKEIEDSFPEICLILSKFYDDNGEEDYIYRFYHQSFKVYNLQGLTKEGYGLIKRISDKCELPLESWFEEIVSEGINKKFVIEHNENWIEATRPILEAFWHTKYFLEQMKKYGNDNEFNYGSTLTSGWVAILTLYGIR